MSDCTVEAELTKHTQGYTLKYRDKVGEKTLIEYTIEELKEMPVVFRQEYIEIIIEKQGVRDALVTLSRSLLMLKP
jgi:hypothetical protein